MKMFILLSGETFLRKGSPPNPFPKTFNLKFFPDRALRYYLRIAKLFRERPVREKYKLKVLGREFEGEPFFKRVSLNRGTNVCISILLGTADFL